MKRLIIAAVGFSLVVGVIVGGVVGNPFDREASAAPPSKGAGRLIELGTQTSIGPDEVAQFPLTDVSDCAQMRMMAQAVGANVIKLEELAYTSPDGTIAVAVWLTPTEVTSGGGTTTGLVEGPFRYIGISVKNVPEGVPGAIADITAWIWCAF